MNRLTRKLRMMVVPVLILPICAAMQAPRDNAPQPRIAPLSSAPDPLSPELSALVGAQQLNTQFLVVSTVNGACSIQVTLGDRAHMMQLSPFSMRSRDCVFYVQDAQGIRTIEPPPTTTYRGILEGVPGATVQASIHDGQVRALIDDGAGVRWGVQPLRHLRQDLPADLHAVFKLTDVMPDPGHCGTGPQHELTSQLPPPAHGGPEGGAGDGRTMIGFDADVEFFQANGSSVATTIADIEWVMNNVGLIYQNQMLVTGICYELNGFIVRTAEPDPYSSSDSSALLCQFTETWNNNVPDGGGGISRDVAHLFTGKELDGNIIGLAWTGTVCDEEFSLPGCSDGKAHYALSQLISNDANRIQLTAHELGHNWSACHCDQPTCTGGGPDPDCGIMNSFVNGSLVFEARGLAAIHDYRSNVSDCLNDCLQTLFVDDDAPYPGCLFGLEAGTSTCPYNTVVEGYDNVHWVGGTLLVAPGNYSGAINMNSVYRAPLTINKWSNGDPGNAVIGAP